MTDLTTNDGPSPITQTTLDQGKAQRQSSDRQMLQTLIEHLKIRSNAPATLLVIAPHCSLDCWLQLFREALNRPQLLVWAQRRSMRLTGMTLRNGALYAKNATTPSVTLSDDSGWRRFTPPILHIAHIIDPDAIGLPCLPPKDQNPPLQLSARQVLRFYGYPQPQNRIQREMVIEEMSRLYSFCGTAGSPSLTTAFEQSNQDLRALAEQLMASIIAANLDETAFSPHMLDRARLQLTSQSFCAKTLQSAATLLKGIIEHPGFEALDQTRDLLPDEYDFDPRIQTIRGVKAGGVPVNIGRELLAPLSAGEPLESLMVVARRLDLNIHVDTKISQAQLLRLHGLELPGTREAAWDLVARLRRSDPLPIPPSGDLANADIALMDHRQRLAIAHDRDTLAVAVSNMLVNKTPSPAQAAPRVMLTDTPLPHPALTPSTPQKQTDLKKGLQRYKLDMPIKQKALQKTLHSLETTQPVSPRLGNYWAALGMPQPDTLTLSAEQRAKVIRVTRDFLPRPNKGLIDLLAADLLADHTLPAEAEELLHKLLARPAVQRLADLLISAVQWYGHAADETTNQASRDALILAALILNLDPHAGETRYRVAGLNLNHSDYWGRCYSPLRTIIELHLIDSGVATSATTALAAHLLLAGIAPEFLVQEIPDSLYFMSSHAWMLFKHGVMLAEALACGSSRHLTFNDVMTLAMQKPGTRRQQEWRTHYATGSLIDWAVAQGELQAVPADHAYSVDEIDVVKKNLDTRIEALRKASTLFATPLTTRRSLARKDLEKVFPKNRFLTRKCLHWKASLTQVPPPLLLPGLNPQSLVELHMSGHLQPFAAQWHSTHPGIDLANMKEHFAKLADINMLFQTVCETRVKALKQAYTCVIQYLLSQLPLADRLKLQKGDVQLLVMRQPAKKPPHLEALSERMARTGRLGFILSCKVNGNVHYYELFPLLNLVCKNDRIPSGLVLGGVSITVTTGNPRSIQPTTVMYLGSRLPIDEQAYLTGRPPRPDQHSTVVLDQLWHFEAAPTLDSPLTFDSPRCRSLANTIVEQHFFLDIDALLVQAREATTLEKRTQNAENLFKVLLGFIPFWSCAHDLASGEINRQVEGAWGCAFDAIGLFLPTKGLLVGGVNRLRNTAPAYVKLLHVAKLSARYLNDTLNPIDLAPSLVRLTGHGLIRLNQSGQQALNTALRNARQRSVPGTATPYTRLIDRADAGPATVTHTDGLTDLLVIKRPLAWYAFDNFSARPYGPQIQNLRLANAMAVTPVSTADGYKALVAQPLFETPPLIMQRANATDLLDQDRVWRLSHNAPSHLDELNSPAFFNLTDELDSVCTPGRQKRSPIPLICFTKKLYPHQRSIQKRRVQALEHIRLIPAPLQLVGKRKLVINRCVHEVSPHGIGFRLTPLPAHPPLQYRPQTHGTFINEPEFGLPNAQLDIQLSTQSSVVKLKGIVDGIDDNRTLRALIVDLSPPSVTVGKHLVVEADVGVFYKTTTVAPGSGDLQFDLLNYSRGGDESALINAYGDLKNQYLHSGGFIVDQPLVTLPTLETLYRQLLQRGFSAEKVALIRTRTNALKKLKQREFLLNTSSEGRRLNINVVAEPITLDTWAPNPITRPGTDQINRYLAEQAYASTHARVETTGIGSANIKGVTRSEALRAQIAEPVVMWEYSKIGHPNYTEVILKTGAGNCDQLAHVAREQIRSNGGTAQLWGTIPPAHAFVLVGTPPAGLYQTADFSQAQWADLWICDPWSSIVCPANKYISKLIATMEAWNTNKVSVLFNDGVQYRWGPANDAAWLNLLNTSIKYALT